MSYIGSALVVMLIAALPLRAADKWIRLSTPNFELYTNTSEAAGKEVVQQFEQLRSFFDQLPDYHQPQLAPIRVVQFSSVEI